MKCAHSSDVRMRAVCRWFCECKESYTRMQPNARVSVKVKVMILLEYSDLFPTDGSARVKGFIIRRW